MRTYKLLVPHQLGMEKQDMLGFGSVGGEYMELLVPAGAATLAVVLAARVQRKYEVLLAASATVHFVFAHPVALPLPPPPLLSHPRVPDLG